MNDDHPVRERKQIRMIERTLNGRGTLLPGLSATRLSRALSQRDLAEIAGTSQGTVQQLESLKRGVYPKTLRKLADALNVPPADLMYPESTTSMKGRDNE